MTIPSQMISRNFLFRISLIEFVLCILKAAVVHFGKHVSQGIFHLVLARNQLRNIEVRSPSMPQLIHYLANVSQVSGSPHLTIKLLLRIRFFQRRCLISFTIPTTADLIGWHRRCHTT